MISLILGILLISNSMLICRRPRWSSQVRRSRFSTSACHQSMMLCGLGLLLLLIFVRVDDERDSKPALIHLALFEDVDAFVHELKFHTIASRCPGGDFFTVPLFMQVLITSAPSRQGSRCCRCSVSVIVGAVPGPASGQEPYAEVRRSTRGDSDDTGCARPGGAHEHGTSPLDLALGLTILGFGNGLIGSTNMNIVLSPVPPDATAEASGANSTLEQVGNSVGVANSGHAADRVAHSWRCSRTVDEHHAHANGEGRGAAGDR